MKTLYICVLSFVTYFQVSLGYLSEKYLHTPDYECIQEMNITQETVQAAFEDDFTAQEGNPVINDFFECGFKKIEYMFQDGSLNFPDIKKWLANNSFQLLGLQHVPNKDEIAENAVTQCETVKGGDNGDTAVRTYNCLMRFIKNAGVSNS